MPPGQRRNWSTATSALRAMFRRAPSRRRWLRAADAHRVEAGDRAAIGGLTAGAIGQSG